MQVSVRREVAVRFGDRPAAFFTFHGLRDDKEHFAVAFGPWREQSTPLVRVHSECLTGDIFGSEHCDCGDQLHEAIERFHVEGGVLIYLRQEGRGIGLYNKMDAYELQAKGADTFEANRLLGFPEDLREFDEAAAMLRAIGLDSVRLLTNNPDKCAQLRAAGIQVHCVVRTGVYLKKANRRYLAIKSSHAGHDIRIEEESK